MKRVVDSEYGAKVQAKKVHTKKTVSCEKKGIAVNTGCHNCQWNGERHTIQDFWSLHGRGLIGKT